MIQTSSWVVGGKAAAINFREGKNGTHFSDKSPFIPHFVKGYGQMYKKFTHKITRK